jgi:hypothetical protein
VSFASGEKHSSDPASSSSSSSSSSTQQCIVLAACQAHEMLPIMNPLYPADIFTACLTTPIPIAIRWFILQNPHISSQMSLDISENIPGKDGDRKTPKGELNWIFTAVADTIAWSCLPSVLFQKLFRQDLLVASLFRNFLLAKRIMKSLNCTPQSIPAVPDCATHPLWHAWDAAVEHCLLHVHALQQKQKQKQMGSGGSSANSPAKGSAAGISFAPSKPPPFGPGAALGPPDTKRPPGHGPGPIPAGMGGGGGGGGGGVGIQNFSNMSTLPGQLPPPAPPGGGVPGPLQFGKQGPPAVLGGGPTQTQGQGQTQGQAQGLHSTATHPPHLQLQPPGPQQQPGPPRGVGAPPLSFQQGNPPGGQQQPPYLGGAIPSLSLMKSTPTLPHSPRGAGVGGPPSFSSPSSSSASSPFFSEQMTAFEIWLDFGGAGGSYVESHQPPMCLPILLQVRMACYDMT